MLNGLRNRATRDGISPEIRASLVSWAIYGAAREWFFTPNRKRAEEVVPSLARLVLPLVNESSRQRVRPKKGRL
jgi:hypothetical protein